MITHKDVIEAAIKWNYQRDTDISNSKMIDQILAIKFNCGEDEIYEAIEAAVDKDYIEFGMTARSGWPTSKGLMLLLND